MSSTATPVIGVATTGAKAGERVEIDLGSPEDFAGWYCIATNPYPCPASGCEFVAEYLTACHLIVVWPEIDDPRLLRHATNARNWDRNPKVKEYEPSMGKALSYDQWYALGRPVHGMGVEPGARG